MSLAIAPTIHSCPDLRGVRSYFLQNPETLVSTVVSGSLVLGAVIGGVCFGPVGAIAGVAISASVAAASLALVAACFHSRPSQEIRFLAKLGEDPLLSDEVKASIGKIKDLVASCPVYLKQSFDLHELCRQINFVSSSMSLATLNLQKRWLDFLQRTEGRRVYYPDGSEHFIETSMARRITRGERISYTVEMLDPKSPEFDAQAEEILRLDEECHARDRHYTLAGLKGQLCDRNAFCYLAKDASTGRVLGALWGKLEVAPERGLFLRIHSVGRKASAARLGVAENLFKEFDAYQRRRGCKASLEVRESNEAAIRLYQKWGFVRTGIMEDYYCYPKENAYIMQRSGYAATRAA